MEVACLCDGVYFLSVDLNLLDFGVLIDGDNVAEGHDIEIDREDKVVDLDLSGRVEVIQVVFVVDTACKQERRQGEPCKEWILFHR